MKRLLRLLCLAAIVCAAYLALTTPRGETGGAIEGVVKQADEVLDNAAEQADGAIEDAVKQADEVLDNAAEQADKAIGDAVDSALQGAKQGFLESLKESASEFWEGLFP